MIGKQLDYRFIGFTIDRSLLNVNRVGPVEHFDQGPLLGTRLYGDGDSHVSNLD